MKRQRELSQREYDAQEMWLASFAREQRDLRKLNEMAAEYGFALTRQSTGGEKT